MIQNPAYRLPLSVLVLVNRDIDKTERYSMAPTIHLLFKRLFSIKLLSLYSEY